VQQIIAERKRDAKHEHKTVKRKNPVLIEEMSKHFDNVGIYQENSLQIRSHLLTVMPAEQVPSVPVLRSIMKEKFHLRYKGLEKANLKYRDPVYNEKRLWTSRVMG